MGFVLYILHAEGQVDVKLVKKWKLIFQFEFSYCTPLKSQLFINLHSTVGNS